MEFTLPTYRAPDFAALGLEHAPDVSLVPAPQDGVAPENYHATTPFPEYFHLNGRWTLAEESRMDCAAVCQGGCIRIVELRRLKKGEPVAVGRSEDGSAGIYVHTSGFAEEQQGGESFSFRQGRSRETAYSMDYDGLYRLLRYERTHGNIVWVLGPACTFDADARSAFAALGQDLYTQRSVPGGHYHHIDTINAVRRLGSIRAFIDAGAVRDGILYECVKQGIPYVLVGSIRDDGPLPEVYGDVYEGQLAMRDLVRSATTILCLASTLHTVATGNMTPSYRVVHGAVRPLYFYSVDISEFAVNKLRDRGSLTVKTIVTNVQDFMVHVRRGVCKPAGPSGPAAGAPDHGGPA